MVYQDVFISRVMLWKDCYKPYWKEKFIDGLPLIFAHKVKQELMGKNDSIDYDSLTYGDILSTIKKLFDDDLPEIKRFVGNLKPMSFTKNWYSKPTPPNMQFEERSLQTQFSVSADKLYE